MFDADAAEDFHGWSIAKYVGQVAAAGKAVYPLPLYVNAALKGPFQASTPVTSEAGGPTHNVLTIWKAAAPAIDIIAPDIYLNDSHEYLKVLDLYDRPDNPMFVPETGSSPENARYFFAALGHGTIGYSPFGIDFTTATGVPDSAETLRWLGPLAANYALISPMDRVIASLNFEGRLQAFSEARGTQLTTRILATGPLW